MGIGCRYGNRVQVTLLTCSKSSQVWESGAGHTVDMFKIISAELRIVSVEGDQARPHIIDTASSLLIMRAESVFPAGINYTTLNLTG
ncbi:hypothetical protein RRG08_036983 [Elysia crispata]|uniref:Uncharacterized protein n=1 Tax=Elysia crispata TaxID=231223 RepID=A0AAE0XTN7_9GAST|nr:hypothetical protein RRG08_036983 [Elysia crispata]